MRKLLIGLALSFTAGLIHADETIGFKKGDRVVFVGPTFVERTARFGHLETALTLAMPEKELIFRNLGWSADTVKGESRGYEKPQSGYANLLRSIRDTKPTLLFLAYGPSESWAATPETFATNYQKLLNDLKDLGARKVLVSPFLQENWGPPMPDPATHNEDLRVHTAIIAQLAAKNGLAHISLIDLIKPEVEKGKRLTMNSLHLDDTGYRALAKMFLAKLGLVTPDLDSAKAIRIRDLIREKNALHFHSWRPQNQTYILSFRKHEQGRHAKDLPKFAPHIAEKEQVIRKLLLTPEEQVNLPAKPKPSSWESIKPSKGAQLDMQKLQVPDDLELNVFASEPAIKNPVQSAWDERGRLWVATAESYPHIAPGFVINDKIIILEDVDRDGVADRRQVFADGLLMPTAILPGHGGVYVGTSTEILHLRDTDGDGRADEKTILISGMGTEDTHHVVHSLRHTEDGKVGFNQSIYINTHIETPWGVRRLLKSGVWTFDPNTHDMEVFAYGLVNPWGHETDEFGQSFLTDGAGGAGIHYAFPGAAYVTSAYHSRAEVLPGLNPGQPKQCGLTIINSGIFPEKYRGLLVTNDFRGHRTISFRLSENGSGFFSTQKEDLIHVASKGTDRHGSAGMYRPIDIDEGPDGALYVNDWSNHIIQHGEVDFHDKRRDHEHGRIWRLQPKDASLPNHADLPKKKPADWLNTLASPELYVRRVARRLLVEKAGPSILPNLLEKARGTDKDETLLEYLWTARSLRAKIPHDLFKRLAESENFRIRAAAIRLGYDKPDAIDDPHPRVRLEAICALRSQGDLKAIETLMRATDHETDRNIDFALREALRHLRPVWEGKTTFENHPTRLARVVTLTGSQAPLDSLLDSLNAKQIDESKRLSTLQALATAGQPKHLDAVLNASLEENLKAPDRLILLRSLLTTQKNRKLMPGKDRGRLAKLFEHPVLGSDALRLAAYWNLTGARAVAIKRLAGASAEDLFALRRHTSTLAAFGKPGIEKLVAFAQDTESTEAELAALEAIAQVDAVSAARLAPAFLAKIPNEVDAAPLFAHLLRSAEAPAILASGLTGKTLSANSALAGIRAATTSGRDLSALVAAIRKAGDLKPMIQNLTAAEMKSLASDVGKHGDPAIGEQVYRRKALACMACHAIGGVGRQVGPDLVSIGASAPIDYLVDSLLAPSKKIKEGYHLTVVNAKGGKVVAGLELSADKTKVVIRDASGAIIEIPAKEILSKSISPTSLMPAGLTASLTRDEFLHLTAFLSALGKEGAYRHPKEAFVRSVEVPNAESARTLKQASNFLKDSTARSNKLHALVNGSIPLVEIPASPNGNRYLRFRLQADVSEEIRFSLDEANGLHMQHEGGRVYFQPQAKMFKHSVKSGTHTYVLAITPQYPADGIKLRFHSASAKVRLLD
jgi:putative heme-binding domain-containing protein